MKQRIVALIALIVSLIAFGVSAGILGFGIKREYNVSGYVIQLVAVLIIVCICATNYVYTCINAKNEQETEDNQEEKENEDE